eukprot:snap_masked-scaffold_1-processed-gene-11.19-mRNA-1 protein AED:1.00 eAED:1.00 QI:0/-1/0/0/-1/1/1/0/67
MRFQCQDFIFSRKKDGFQGSGRCDRVENVVDNQFSSAWLGGMIELKFKNKIEGSRFRILIPIKKLRI